MRSIFTKFIIAVTLSMSLPTAAFPQAHSTHPVTVRILRVRQIDDLEGPLNGKPDFRASIAIDGERRWMLEVSGKDLTPGSLWFFTKEECGNLVKITIALWEDDAMRRGVAHRDEHCDINPRRGSRDLKLTYHPITGRIAGDVSGRRGDVIRVRGAGESNRAEIWFSVN